MNEYYFDVGREYSGIQRVGLCSRLRFLNYFMYKARLQGDICYPRFTIKGVDHWNDFFEPGTAPHDHVTVAADTVIDYEEFIKSYDHYQQPNNFRISFTMRERAKKAAQDTKIGVQIRETDKHDYPEVAFPSSLYIARIKEVEGSVFCCSDCNHTIGRIMRECPNAWCLPDVYRSDFFPLHKDYQLDELSSSQSLLTELSILMEMEEVWYGTFSGLINFLQVYNVPVKNLFKDSPKEIQDIIAYYAWRERNLWNLIDQKVKQDWRGW